MQGDFYFVRDPLLKTQCSHAYRAITQLNLWGFLKEGRVYSYLYPVHDIATHDILYRAIVWECVQFKDYTVIMRTMEYISKYGWDDWKVNYIYAYRLDMVRAVRIISHRMFEVLYDPSFELCRRRLRNEFFNLVEETPTLKNNCSCIVK